MGKDQLIKRRLIIHPFLFASFASLSLMANNLVEVGFAGIRAFVFTIAFALVTLIIFRLILKDSVKAGLSASGAVLLIFSYGHVLDTLQKLLPIVFLGRGSLLLVFLWAVVFYLWYYFVTRKLRDPDRLSRYLNYFAIALNILPIYTIVTFSGQTADIPTLTQEFIAQNRIRIDEMEMTPPQAAQLEELPDIYYIVLDAYTRSDVLEELYDYDNLYFVNFLEDRGFYVNKEARSNYTNTELSISTVLNMMHISSAPIFLRERGAPDNEDTIRLMAGELIKGNIVRKFLDELGYTFVSFDNGYDRTQILDADKFMASPDVEDAGFWQIGFEYMLLDTTLGREIVKFIDDTKLPHRKLLDAHRERVLFTLSNLPNISQEEGAHFVYAHILSPHVPFIFDANGDEVAGHDIYTLLDAHPGNEANIMLYRDQLHYVSQLVMDTIDQILENSDVTPIIILQADHGSKVYREIAPPISVKMDLNFSILGAYLIPDAPEDLLYSGITPVNIFRVIFNHTFGTELPLLDDGSYVLEIRNGQLEFVNACEEYDACPFP